jgi:hypothetical protein
MKRRRLLQRTLLITGTAALAIGVGAATALAAALTLTVTVSGGGNLAASARAVFADTATGTSLTCSSAVHGTIPNGTTEAGSPVKIGDFSTLSFSDCAGPMVVRVTAEKLPYGFKVDSMTVGGDTDVIIAGFDVSVAMTGCSFAVTGSAPGYFDNSNHTLYLTGSLPISPQRSAKLMISGVSGCAGLLANGDHATYTVTYKLGHLLIKST